MYSIHKSIVFLLFPLAILVCDMCMSVFEWQKFIFNHQFEMFLFTKAHAIEKSIFVTFRFDVHKNLNFY